MRRVYCTLLVAAVSIVGAGCSGDSGGYSLETEQEFVSRCAEENSRGECRCIYLRFVEEVPYDRFVELDEQSAADQTFTAPEIERFALDCAAGLAE